MAAIAVKIDEDLPAEFAHRLRARGHEAATVFEQGWSGLTDAQLWPRIQNETRWLFTADKGFADARLHPPGTHGGIVLFRLPRETRRGYLRLLDTLMASLDLGNIKGAIVTISPDAIRILHDRRGKQE